MTTKTDTRNARTKAATRAQTIAIERFRVRIQAALHTLMKRRRITQGQLAERMGISPPRVSQIFADDANVTLRTLGQVLHAMGMEPQVTCDGSTLIVRTTSGDWTVSEDAAGPAGGELLQFATRAGGGIGEAWNATATL